MRPPLRCAVIQTAQDLNLVLARFQWLQGAAELEVGSITLGPPGGRNGAVREEDKGRAKRCARGGRGQNALRPRGGEQPGCAKRRKRPKRDRCAHPAQAMAATAA